MNKYESGENDFHNFLKGTRKNSGAPMWQIAMGICSVSAISRMESGERVQEKLMRDRVLGRLGVSQEYFEEYLRVEEYAQWKQRMLVLDCIRQGDIASAGRELDRLKEISEKNVVQSQFADAMNYMILQLQGAPRSLLCAQAYLGIIRTVPSYEMAFSGAQLLDVQELNLILEFFHNLEYVGTEEAQWRLNNYKQILDYMEKFKIDEIGQAKIYPRIACYVGELFVESTVDTELLDFAYKLCTKALSLLRRTQRRYCYVELLERRIFIGNRLMSRCKQGEEREKLLRNKEADTRKLSKIKEDYAKYGMNPYTRDFTYLYEEGDCKSAIEVVQTRMELMKISRQKMEKSACSCRTLLRMQRHNESITLNVIKSLFAKLGIYPDYKSAPVISENMRGVELFYQLNVLMEQQKWEKANLCLKSLKNELDLDIPQNEQTVGLMEILLNYQMGSETMLSVEELFIDKLECTLSVDVLDAKEHYLTKMEWLCIYEMAIRTEGELSQKCLKMLDDFCKGLLQESMSAAVLGGYGAIICSMVRYYLEAGEIETGEQLQIRYEEECLKLKKCP